MCFYGACWHISVDIIVSCEWHLSDIVRRDWHLMPFMTEVHFMHSCIVFDALFCAFKDRSLFAEFQPIFVTPVIPADDVVVNV